MIDLMQIIVAILAAGVPFMIAQRYGLLNWASPLHFVAYFTFFGFTVKAVVYAFFPEMAFYANFRVSETDVGWGYVYLAGFILMVSLGYLIAVRPGEKIDRVAVAKLVERIRSPGLLLGVAIAVTLLTTVVYLTVRDISVAGAESSLEIVHGLNSRKIERIQGESDFGNSYAIIKIFYVLPSAIFVLLVLRAAVSRTRSAILYASAISGVMILSALIQGKRGDLLDLLLYGIISWSLSGRKFDYKSISAAIMSVPVILIVFSFMSNLRAARGDISSVDLISFESLKPIVTSTYFVDINIPILISALSRPDQLFFGQTYLNVLFAWIPRFVWADKPAVAIGPYVKQQVLGIQSIGGANPTGAGEAFLNFGWWGILVGFILGFAFRRLEVSMLSERGVRRYYGPILYTVVFLGVLQGVLQSSFAAAVIAALAQAVIVWMLCRTLISGFGRKSNAGRRRSPSIQHDSN